MGLNKGKLAISILLCFVLIYSVFVVAENSTPEDPVVVEEIQNEPPQDNTTMEGAVEDNSSEIPAEEPITNTTDGNTSEPINITEQNPLKNETIEIPQNETQNTSEEIPIEEPSLFKSILNLILDQLSVIKGELFKIQAQLTYENNSPITGKPVDIRVNDEKIATKTTDDSGLAEFDWDTSSVEPGVYIIGVDYTGDGILESSADSAQVTVNAEEELNETIMLNETIPENLTELPILNLTGDKIQKIEDCKEIEWAEEENVYGTCTDERTVLSCSDPPANKSCTTSTEVSTYDCVKDTKVVKKTREECKTTALVINGEVKLNVEDYVCSTEEDGNEVTVLCDSRYDGNGDGKCTSGESCMKFVVNGAAVSKSEKNSEDEFKEADDSFFIEKASVEVLE